MKTIREWFNELPEPLRSDALEDAVRSRGFIILEAESESLHDAINRGIRCSDPYNNQDWSEVFWQEVESIQDRTRAIEPLPPA